VTHQWFSQGTPVSSTNKTDSNDITEILLKVELNTIDQTKPLMFKILKETWLLLTMKLLSHHDLVSR
jgi:hypothetical protein